MLLTDRFTYVHEPKTGGTFVTYVMTRLHGALVDVRPTRRRGPVLRRLGLYGASYYAERRGAAADDEGWRRYGPLYNWNDHGTCSEIPRSHRSRTILATVRSPFETYVSLFLFGWWRRPESVRRFERIVPGFRRRFPGFPELSFREYLELLHAQCVLPSNRELDGEGVGFLTERFVRYYFRLPRTLRAPTFDAAAVLRRIDDSYLDGGRYGDDMYDVRFLRTASLNEELREFLLETGYEEGDLEFVAGLRPVVPVGGTKVGFVERARSLDWHRYVTPELEAVVRRRDRLFFTLFPELDPAPAEAAR